MVCMVVLYRIVENSVVALSVSKSVMMSTKNETNDLLCTKRYFVYIFLIYNRSEGFFYVENNNNLSSNPSYPYRFL